MTALKSTGEEQGSRKKSTYYQKENKKLLVNFDCYNRKYIARIEYQKIINLLENANNQPRKFKTKNWIQVNDYRNNRTQNPHSQTRFKSTILRSRLCKYNEADTFVKGAIQIIGEGADAAAQIADERKKQLTFKNCMEFTY